MKKVFVSATLLALCAMLVVFAGCGGSKTSDKANDLLKREETEGVGEDEKEDAITQTDYDLGLAEGYEDGYEQGNSDGENGASYSPRPEIRQDWDDYYAEGYEEGFLDGYANGYEDATAGQDDVEAGADEAGEDELAEVEAAMIDFVQANAAAGLEFEIRNLKIHDGEAAGIAVCTNQSVDSVLVVMRKGPSGWEGVDLGTGIDAPSWYTY